MLQLAFLFREEPLFLGMKKAEQYRDLLHHEYFNIIAYAFTSILGPSSPSKFMIDLCPNLSLGKVQTLPAVKDQRQLST